MSHRSQSAGCVVWSERDDTTQRAPFVTFAVTINDGPHYVVHAKTSAGAVKAALAADESFGAERRHPRELLKIIVVPGPSEVVRTPKGAGL